MNKNKIIFVSTFPPRECGIATYTESLIDSINKNESSIKCEVVAINSGKNLKYSGIVKKTIDQEDSESYTIAAKFINESDAAVVSVQHEFWIYGGFNGRKILSLLKGIKKPIVLTLHSVPISEKRPYKIIPDRFKSRTNLLKEIFSYVSAVIVMTDSAKKYLCKEFSLGKDKVFVLSHGAPALSEKDISHYKSEKELLGLGKNDFILTSFWLISPKKGLEYVIKALPSIISKNPNLSVKYIIAGEMRPNKSEKYLSYLKQLTKRLRLENNVVFDNRYLTVEEIFRYLANTDIYITPYYKKEQASSGTLSYALSAGCCIVSTPYFFARDLIEKHGVGELVNFKDSISIAKMVNSLIENRSKISDYQKKSYQVGKSIEFSRVTDNYIKILEKQSKGE